MGDKICPLQLQGYLSKHGNHNLSEFRDEDISKCVFACIGLFCSWYSEKQRRCALLAISELPGILAAK
jgi:hypothetical protein